MNEKNFWERVDRPQKDACWPWTKTRLVSGYGQVYVGRDSGFAAGILALAHRVAYQLAVGPILEGLTIDHLCRNRACCNPAHLEAVTGRENGLRGFSPPAINARKTHCIHGHEFTEENTYRPPSGQRECIKCKRAFAAINNPKRRKAYV
jgi:hypothetical protein